MGTRTNILVGGITNVKVGSYGAGEGAAVDVGFSKEGVTYEFVSEHHKSYVDQAMGPVKMKKISEEMMIKFAMAEASLANLALAFDYPVGAVAAGKFDFGGNAAENYREIYLNGEGPAGATRKATLYYCVVTGTSGQAYLKDGERVVDIEMHVLEDVTKTASQRFGKIEDTAADTTPPTVAMDTPAEDGTVAKTTTDPVILAITETNNMDESTIIYGDGDNATIMIINITDTTATVLVAGSITYNSATKKVTFIPSGAWNASDKMQVIVTTGLKDEAGNSLAAMFAGHFTVTA